MNRNSTILAAVALVAVLGAASPAQAQAIPAYSCVGSAGAVDESGMAIFETNGPEITIKNGGPSLKRLVVRYPITPVEALASPVVAGALEFSAMVKDAGAGSFVKLLLYEVDLQSGETTAKLRLDSDLTEASPEWKEITASECDQQIAGLPFDFENKAYYIYAVLGQHNGGQAPALHHVRLRFQSACE